MRSNRSVHIGRRWDISWNLQQIFLFAATKWILMICKQTNNKEINTHLAVMDSIWWTEEDDDVLFITEIIPLVTWGGNCFNKSNAVRPSLSVTFKSAPKSSRAFTTVSFPHNAASCSAVPDVVSRLTSTPAANKISTTFLWPFRLAKCNGECVKIVRLQPESVSLNCSSS